MIVGRNNTLYKTIDAGKTWTEVVTGDVSDSDYKIIHYITKSKLWIYAIESNNIDSYFLLTENGGLTWRKLISSEYLKKPKHFINRNVGYITLLPDDVLKTTDGGITWNKLNNSFSYSGGYINTLFFVNEYVGYIGGEYKIENMTPHPQVYKTLDGGNSWEQILFDGTSYSSIRCMFFLNEILGWVCSPTGLHKTMTGGLTDIQYENLCDNYLDPKLYQNYPNPFNPNTTIQYYLPKPMYVKISIYNTLGNKVATLLNKYQKSGHYKIQYNANPMSSGIYYCRIITEGYSETKKIILLK